MLKTWRIHPEQSLVTFGASKHADLRSPDTNVKGIQGLFEQREDAWYFVNLEIKPQGTVEPVEIELKESVDLRLGSTILKVTPFEGRKSLLGDIDRSDMSTPGTNREPYQLFSVYHAQILLETKILKLGKSFVSQFDPTHTKVVAQKSDGWTKITVGAIEITQRTIYLLPNEVLGQFSLKQLFDKESRIPTIATLIGAMILGILFLLSPSSQDVREVAISAVAPKDLQEIKTVIPKEKRKAIPSQPTQTPKPSQAAAPATNNQPPAAAQNKVSAIKSLSSSSRFSQLLGKVSASAAKSANVVVTPKGVEAGQGPSGPAANALNKIGKTSTNWSNEGRGGVANVSTVGRGGGAGGMGTLATGSTGAGGAELIEDEGEISGGLDREVIAEVIKSQLGQILYCYERQLSANPELFGKVSIKFTIAPTGAVESQFIKESTLKNATVEGCILQRVAKWKFPNPKGGSKVMVTYPFLFKSTN